MLFSHEVALSAQPYLTEYNLIHFIVKNGIKKSYTLWQ